MSTRSTTQRGDPLRPHSAGPGSYPGAIIGSSAYWILVGILGGLGVAALMSIGIYLLGVAAVLFTIGVIVPAIDKRAIPTTLAGVAMAPFYIAWLNRQGPGDICTQSANSVSCGDQWDPWPFVAVGIVLLLASAALTWLALRQPPTDRHSG